MDSNEQIKPYKDTSLALMLAAQELGHELVYLPKNGLCLDHGGDESHHARGQGH